MGPGHREDRGYIYSRLILAVLSSIAHFIAFEAIGIPFPLPLALWVGVISQFIPVVGTYIAGALPLVIGLLDDPGRGIAVLIVIVVYQQIENYVFAPASPRRRWRSTSPSRSGR
ncbi:MAG: AI-2E family transporter [Acidimicrobiales bacterium]